MNNNARLIASNIINQLLQRKQPLTSLLSQYRLQNNVDSLVPALCFGTIRLYPQLHFIAQQLLQKPIKNKDNQVFTLLLIGLYQIIAMRIPEHAAINETVLAAKSLKAPWAAGLINAVLRNYCRNQDSITELVNNNAVAKFAHPLWLLQRLQSNWPQHWQTIVTNNNMHPPQTLRVNQQKIHRDDYLLLLQQHHISAYPIANLPHAIVIEQPIDITALPKFNQGYVSIQDGAAQLTASLLTLSPNMKILDACAAPGGKTCQLLEQQPDINCLALDISAKRCKLIVENLQRCQLHATVATHDASKPQQWWDAKQFDAIIIDAPCSATGVIRRNPDIKLLRKPAELNTLINQQRQLLLALWPLLKPHGTLLYITCSILAEENQLQMEQFIQQHQDALVNNIQLPNGIPLSIGQQILPNNTPLDGFYYAKLTKML